ncbi:TerD family protein [Defluviimonas salinarum]|uniref:TerD family protein n=1 Tax=Defluviimonas salinarum TaxID=2992147 RepID=A0ABT3J4E5_9RHOB|nr:TerD family protein [Defluviimonas salinarum]MCW3782535.1 TerD family protein [Defluviimonas salinarum]
MQLSPGQNVDLPEDEVAILIDRPGAGHVIHAILIDAAGRALSPGRTVFYGNGSASGIRARNLAQGDPEIVVTLSRLPDAASKVLVVLSVHAGSMAALGQGRLSLRSGADEHRFELSFAGFSERSLILGEIYRRGEGFRFRALAQGFMRGIEALNETYGAGLETAAPIMLPEPARAAREPSHNQGD